MSSQTNADHGVDSGSLDDTPADDSRYVTIDVEVSGDLEARWVYDAEHESTRLMLRHLP